MKQSQQIIGITLVFVITMGVIGVSFFNTQNRKSLKQVSQVSPDLVERWKSYSNKRFNFSFQYPPELTYLYDQLQQVGDNTLIQNFDGLLEGKIDDDDFQMVISVIDNHGKRLEDYPSDRTKISTSLTIDGQKAISGFSDQKGESVPTIWVIKDELTYTFQLSTPNSTNKDWFEQIISSVRFSTKK